jgi:hypothetical protein
MLVSTARLVWLIPHGKAAPRRRLAEHARGMLVRPLEELQQRLGLAAAIGIRH